MLRHIKSKHTSEFEAEKSRMYRNGSKNEICIDKTPETAHEDIEDDISSHRYQEDKKSNVQNLNPLDISNLKRNNKSNPVIDSVSSEEEISSNDDLKNSELMLQQRKAYDDSFDGNIFEDIICLSEVKEEKNDLSGEENICDDDSEIMNVPLEMLVESVPNEPNGRVVEKKILSNKNTSPTSNSQYQHDMKNSEKEVDSSRKQEIHDACIKAPTEQCLNASISTDSKSQKKSNDLSRRKDIRLDGEKANETQASQKKIQDSDNHQNSDAEICSESLEDITETAAQEEMVIDNFEPILDKPSQCSNSDRLIDESFVPKGNVNDAFIDKKGSIIWDFFEPTVLNEVRCNLCGETRQLDGAKSTTNCLNHLMRKHKARFEAAKLKRDHQKSVPDTFANKRYKSIVWTFFKHVSSSEVECNLCGLTRPFVFSSTSNFLRHIILKHKSEFDAENKKLPNKVHVNHYSTKKKTEPCQSKNMNLPNRFYKEHSDFTIRERSIVWMFFRRISLFKIQCHLCGKLQNYHKTKQTTSNMLKHVKEKHCAELIAEKEKRKQHKSDLVGKRAINLDNKSIVWRFFTQTSSEKVTCNLCGFIQNHIPGGTTTSNMVRHLKLKHKSEFEADRLKLNSSSNKSKTQIKEKEENNLEVYQHTEEISSGQLVLCPQTGNFIPARRERNVKRLKPGIFLRKFVFQRSSTAAECKLCGEVMTNSRQCKTHFESRHSNIYNTELELMKTKEPFCKTFTKSVVWTFMTPMSPQQVKCCLCGCIIESSTLCILNHLKHYHKEEYRVETLKKSKLSSDHYVEEIQDIDVQSDMKIMESEKSSDLSTSDACSSKKEDISKDNSSLRRYDYLKFKSIAWSFFKQTSSGKVECVLCGKAQNYVLGGPTSNMMKHLKSSHKSELEAEQSKRCNEVKQRNPQMN